MNSKSFDAVCFGEILWDVLPSGAKPGGAPMNVAYHLQKLGLQTAMLSRVGKDEKGEALIDLLQDCGIATDFVQRDGDHKTGIVNATLLANNEVSYDIVYPVAWDFITWEKSLSEMVAQSRFFIYGSLAARNQQSFQTLEQLIAVAQTRVVDINLRPPFFSKDIVENLLAKADIVKLNEHEVAMISQWYRELTTPEDQVRFLQDKFSVSQIIVTKGGEGALVCKEGEITAGKGYAVKVADTVGSGDAFLAAFLYKTNKGAPLKESLEFANALGALIASKQGACPPYDVKDVMQLMSQSLPV